MATGKTKAYSTKEMARILLNNGFVCDRINGDHYIYKKGNSTVVINRNVNKMVCRRLIKENNLKL